MAKGADVEDDPEFEKDEEEAAEESTFRDEYEDNEGENTGASIGKGGLEYYCIKCGKKQKRTSLKDKMVCHGKQMTPLDVA
ncbi:hypothetical protein HY993_04575 [Candidatus Micrarchaeota archaeon]|nr:hypothetical protein [Candidatus Micrarchaeota archaeon]